MTPIITLKVSGMSCGHCVKAVTGAIQAKDPAAKIVVDLAAGTVDAETTLPRKAVSRGDDVFGVAWKLLFKNTPKRPPIRR